MRRRFISTVVLGGLFCGPVFLWRQPAWADSPAGPLAIAPFHNRCFAAADLADQVRARGVPSVRIAPGAANERSADQIVSVKEADRILTVEVRAYGARGQLLAEERRVLPSDADCEVLLDMTASIALRAAVPLSWRDRPAPRPARPHAVATSQPSSPAASTTAAQAAPSPQAAAAPASTPAATSTGASTSTVAASTATAAASSSVPASIGSPALTISRSAPSNDPARRFELGAAALWVFPLDGGTSTPLGEVELGFRWRRFRSRLGISIRGGVSGTFSDVAKSNPTISVSVRAFPLAAEIHYDLPVPRGAIRIGLGPLVELWRAQSSGLLHDGSRTFAEPGISIRAAYRFSIDRVVLALGVDLSVRFIRDELEVLGVGKLTGTPLVELGPVLAAAVRL